MYSIYHNKKYHKHDFTIAFFFKVADINKKKLQLSDKPQ